jgi:hypothetical protein
MNNRLIQKKQWIATLINIFYQFGKRAIALIATELDKLSLTITEYHNLIGGNNSPLNLKENIPWAI